MSVKERVQEALIDFYNDASAILQAGAIVMSRQQWIKFRSECGPQDELYHESRHDRWTYGGHPIWISHHINGPAVISAIMLRGLRGASVPRESPANLYTRINPQIESPLPADHDPILY